MPGRHTPQAGRDRRLPASSGAAVPPAVWSAPWLIRLRDGVVTDDIDLADGYPADEMTRRAGQLG